MHIFRCVLKHLSILLMLVCLSACSSPSRHNNSYESPTRNRPDPVLVIYHVKRGSEEELAGVLKSAWDVYLKEKLVFPQPHVCVRIKEDDQHIRIVEMFTWVGHFATEHPTDSVRRLWDQMQALCEDRHGNLGIEFRRAEMLIP